MEYTKGNKQIQHGEILVDRKKSGRERPWAGKKKAAVIMSKVFELLGMFEKAARLAFCAHYLIFKLYTETGEREFVSGQFCKVRMCPICAMRRSEKVFGQVGRIMSYIEKEPEYKNLKYIFVTLTMRNMPGNELSGALDKLFYGFKKMCERKEFKKLSLGWFRALEVTHNWEKDTYHPHLHMIIAVDKRYFSEYENYLNHNAWMSLWRSCMQLDYDPWVHVEKVRKNKKIRPHKSDRPGNVVAELAKYTLKDSDYMILWVDRGNGYKEHLYDIEDESYKREMYEKMARVVSVLDPALHKRRLAAFGGIFKKIHKILDLDDPIEGDLDEIESEEDAGLSYIKQRFEWGMGFGNYYMTCENIEKE
jgi:plasmid rolling circle replication initiator protein Rep